MLLKYQIVSSTTMCVPKFYVIGVNTLKIIHCTDTVYNDLEHSFQCQIVIGVGV